MAKNNFREYDQRQLYWSTINLEELLEADHPARIVDKIIERLNLKCIYDYYSEEGNPPYHPKMMLKILFYGYYSSQMSCRKMWNSVKYRADFMYLAAGQVPNFRTINKFRLRHLEVLPDLFTQIVFLCAELDMIGFEHLAIDGENIKGCASFKKNKDIKGLKIEYEKTKRGLKHLIEQEISEDFSEETKIKRRKKVEKKLQKIEEMKSKLETFLEEDEKEKKRKDGSTKKNNSRKRSKDEIKLNMTDGDSKAMKHKDGRILPSYNHQSAVDGKYGVSCALKTRMSSDYPDDLLPLVDEANKNTENKFKNILADCAFGGFEIFEKIDKERDEDFYVPDVRFQMKKASKLPKGKYDLDNFTRDTDGKITCPDGYSMDFKGIKKKNDTHIYKYQGTHCDKCENHDDCTKLKFRSIKFDTREEYQTKMREKLDSDKGREIYMKRQGIVEPVHGDDQKNRGWIQHHLRGYFKAKAEFILVRIASNLRKIAIYRSNEILAKT